MRIISVILIDLRYKYLNCVRVKMRRRLSVFVFGIFSEVILNFQSPGNESLKLTLVRCSRVPCDRGTHKMIHAVVFLFLFYMY